MKIQLSLVVLSLSVEHIFAADDNVVPCEVCAHSANQERSRSETQVGVAGTLQMMRY